MVFGYCGPRLGAYAEYLSMREDGVVTTKPANMTDEEAAGCPYGALMALGLLRMIRLQPDNAFLSSAHREESVPRLCNSRSNTSGPL